MTSRWIFLTCVLLVAILLTSASVESNSDPLLKEGDQQLDLLLEAINELERQRVQENTGDSSHKSDIAKQRPNSKRLRWNRRRSNTLGSEGPEDRGFAAYSSSLSYPPNPDYIDVRDHEATPAPWWFNIN